MVNSSNYRLLCNLHSWALILVWITGVQDALNTVNRHGGFPLPNVLIPLHLLVCFHSKSNSKTKPVPLTASSFIWKIKIMTTLLCFHKGTLFYLALDFLILVHIKKNNKEFNYIINLDLSKDVRLKLWSVLLLRFYIQFYLMSILLH